MHTELCAVNAYAVNMGLWMTHFFFLLNEKVWNSCECVWWSSARIMIAFTKSCDRSRFPPSTGERWLMRNWCVSKHTSLYFFLSNIWFKMQMIHVQIRLDVGKCEQQRIRTRSAHHREWSGGAQYFPQWSGGIGSVYHCRPGTFFTDDYKMQCNKRITWTVMWVASVTHLFTWITGWCGWPAGEVQQATGETFSPFNFQPSYALKLH